MDTALSEVFVFKLFRAETATGTVTTPPIVITLNDFISKIQDKNGIIVFDVVGWNDATGHFTLWEKGNLSYVGANQEENNPLSPYYYVWMVEPRYDGTKMYLVETVEVRFWELK